MSDAALSKDQVTFEAWASMPDEEAGELVDGEIVEEEMATIIHETLVSMLNALLRAWLGAGRGLVGGSNARFRVSSRRGRRPDLYVYFPSSELPPPDAAVVELAPDIMIEVVSTATSDQRRDRVEKLREYERFGVAFYWLVDPEFRSFEIFELGSDGRYIHAVTATEGRIDPVPGCEGLAIDVDALWAEVDRLLARG